MDKTLQISFQNALKRLISIYLLGLLTIIVLLLYFDRLQHARLGNTLAVAIHNSIVIRDLRTAVSILNHSVPGNFSRITLYAANGDRIFSLPFAQEVKANADWLETRFSVPLHSSTTGEALLGRVHFSYFWFPPIIWSACLGLMMLLGLWPIYYRMRLQVVLRHEELVRKSEAELTAEIARKVAHDIRPPPSVRSI